MLQLQAPVSAPQSIKTQISNTIFRDGISAFFRHHIPFSYTTGADFAQKISQWIIACLTEKSHMESGLTHKAIHVYEFGAGLGILSERIAQLLKSDAPKLYNQLQLHITEYEPKLVESYSRLTALKPYIDHMRFEVKDVTNLTFESDATPTIGYMGYLLDSLPVRHVAVKNGQITELKISSYLAENIIIWDNETPVPKQLNSTDIQRLILEKNFEKLAKLWPQITPHFKEEYEHHPINDAWLPEEKEDLQNFVKTLPEAYDDWFNYCPAIRPFIQRFFEANTMGTLLSYDFGTDHLHKGKWGFYGSFGLGRFGGVHFPYLRYLADTLNIAFYQGMEKNGDSRFLCFYKGPMPQESAAQFRQIFGGDFREDNAGVAAVKSAERVFGDAKKITQKLNDIFTQLPAHWQNDYSTLTQFGEICLRHNLTAAAQYYFEKSLPHYEQVALPSYKGLGDAAYKEGRHEDALKWYKKAYKLSDTYPPILMKLGGYYMKINDYETALSFFERYLKVEYSVQFWVIFLLIIQCHQKLGNTEVLAKLRHWIKDIQQLPGQSIPPAVLKIAGISPNKEL